MVTVERKGGEKKKKCVCVFQYLPANSFLVIIEIDVCCRAVNLRDILLIKRQTQPNC